MQLLVGQMIIFTQKPLPPMASGCVCAWFGRKQISLCSHNIFKNKQICQQNLILFWVLCNFVRQKVMINEIQIQKSPEFSVILNPSSLNKLTKFYYKPFLRTKKYSLHLTFSMTIMNSAESSILQRNLMLQVILANKKLSALFPRDMQYHAIAIIDKFLSMVSECQQTQQKHKQACYYSIAALIIAFKFQKNDDLRLKQIYALLRKPEQVGRKYEIKNIIQAEGLILQTIQFQIPQTTCFLNLQNFLINEDINRDRNQFQIKLTMKLLKEITLISQQTSFYPQIGSQLYELVERRKQTQRTRNLYTLVMSSSKRQVQVVG